MFCFRDIDFIFILLVLKILNDASFYRFKLGETVINMVSEPRTSGSGFKSQKPHLLSDFHMQGVFNFSVFNSAFRLDVRGYVGFVKIIK